MVVFVGNVEVVELIPPVERFVVGDLVEGVQAPTFSVGIVPRGFHPTWSEADDMNAVLGFLCDSGRRAALGRRGHASSLVTTRL